MVMTTNHVSFVFNDIYRSTNVFAKKINLHFKFRIAIVLSITNCI